jgi:hypothetical protein
MVVSNRRDRRAQVKERRSFLPLRPAVAASDAAPSTVSEEAAHGEEQKNDDDQQNEHVTRFL